MRAEACKIEGKLAMIHIKTARTKEAIDQLTEDETRAILWFSRVESIYNPESGRIEFGPHEIAQGPDSLIAIPRA